MIYVSDCTGRQYLLGIITSFLLGFDNVWEYVPNLTARQVTLMILTGIVSLQVGIVGG